MAKYIVDLDDRYVSPENELIISHLNLFDGCSYHVGTVKLTPYTEPDMEQIRKEAYAEGYKEGMQLSIDDAKLKEAYQRGLNDAWDATKKIALDKEDGGLDTVTYCEIFGYGKGFGAVLKTYTASEAIEKIRQYEQKQKKKDGVWIASETWFVSEANEPSVDTILICSKCGYAIKIKPHETPALNFCPKCGDCKKPKEEES